MLPRWLSTLSRFSRFVHHQQPAAHVATYKSQYSLDKLYSSSTIDALKNVSDKVSKSPDGDGSFSGIIPLDQINIAYSRSSGPGGQHVNKVNTKVEVRFHVPSAEWLSPITRENLMELEKNRITKDGFLIVSCEKTRKQYLNQAECLDKIRCFIRNAEKPPYEPSEEEIMTMNKRKGAAKQAILREKRAQSLKKQSRHKPNSLD